MRVERVEHGTFGLRDDVFEKRRDSEVTGPELIRLVRGGHKIMEVTQNGR